MEFVAHRINTIEELQKTPGNYGAELDLRESGGSLMLQHEPFAGGELFSEYLKCYRHGVMIVNVKSEGVEFRAAELLREAGIENYFFLDSSFPMLVKLARAGERRTAVRFSEYEDKATALNMRGSASWVWVDCFNAFTLDRNTCDEFRAAGFKLCLVSPELQGRGEDIEIIAGQITRQDMRFDAVCSKAANAEKWALLTGG